MVTEIWSAETIELRNRRTKSPGFFNDPKKQLRPASTYELSPQGERSISAKIYPNGEFGVGYVRKKKISAQERRYEADRRYADENAEIIADIEISPDGESFTYGRKIIPGTLPPKLGIGSESSQARKKYGLKGITSYGRKMVRNGGTVIERAYKGQYNRLMQMGTLTLPAYCAASMKNVCINWGNIVRRFYQECKRQYARKGFRFDYVGVTEIQPKRLQNRREVGLHLHYLYVAIRDISGEWILSDAWVREKWRHILGVYLAASEQGILPNYRRESVKASAAAYLSKYMSKGGDQIKQVVEEFGEDWLPSQWWSMNTGVRHCIKVHTVSSTGELAEKLLVISRWGVSDYIKYVRCITLPVETNQYAEVHVTPKEIVLGYGGLLSPAGYALFSPSRQCDSISWYLPGTLDNDNSLVTS